MLKEKFYVMIGTSAGGTLVLPELIKQFTEEMNIAVFVALHYSKKAVGEMIVNRLQKQTSYTCKIPKHGELIRPNHIYIAKPDHHLLVKKKKILIGKGPMENRYRPSIDALFRSGAVAFAQQAVGIVLTGMLEDGASGMVAIKRSGGICMVQDPNEAKYPDLPQAVMQQLEPDYVLPVEEMGQALNKAMRDGQQKIKAKVPDDVVKEAEIAEKVQIGFGAIQQIDGDRSTFSCPDCGGALWEIKNNGISRYRCHVGHSFTEDGLLTGMEVSTGSALWTALRIIEERRNLLAKIAERERRYGRSSAARMYSIRVRELEAQIEQLKATLFNVEQG
jgi:two-component system chemotaxis response regulator CheB